MLPPSRGLPVLLPFRSGFTSTDLADGVRRNALTLVLAMLTGSLCAMLGFVIAPVGATAEAVLVLPLGHSDLLAGEVLRLRSAEMTQAVVARINRSQLLECDWRRAPMALLATTCLRGGDAAARAEAAVQASLRLDDTDPLWLRMSIQHGIPEMAVAMLQSAILVDADLRRPIAARIERGISLPGPDPARRLLASLDQRIAQLRISADGQDPEQELAGVQLQLGALGGLEAELAQRLTTLRAELTAAQRLLRTTPATLTETDSSAQTVPPPEASRQILLQLQLERTHMQAAYKEGYPGIVELDRKIRLAEAALRRPLQSSSLSARVRPNPTFAALTETGASLAPRGDGLEAQLQEVRLQRANLQIRGAVLQDIVVQLDQLRGEREAQAGSLSTIMAATRSPEALESARALQTAQAVTDMHFVPQAMALAWPAATRPAISSLSGLLGLTAFIGLVRRRERRPQALASPRPQRALQCLARIDLPINGAAAPPELVERMLYGQSVQSAEASEVPFTVHLIGTDARDGVVEIARMLAAAIIRLHGVGVLVAEFAGTGASGAGQVLEAFTPDQSEAAADGMTPPDGPATEPVRGIHPVASSHALVLALIGSPQRQDLAMMLQLRRLRAAHRVLIMLSYGTEATDLQKLDGVRANVTALVLHADALARSSLAARIGRLCRNLGRLNQAPCGYIVTQGRTLT